MHVLVAGPSSSSETDITPVLRQLGHAVSSCHETLGDECVALRGTPCPLEGLPIDVVIADPSSETSRCARRRAVPVVDTETDESILAARLATAVIAMPRHTNAAMQAARHVLDSAGAPEGPLAASVDRRHGGLLATVVGPAGMSARLRQRISVRVHAELRKLDPCAPSIDIVVKNGPGDEIPWSPFVSAPDAISTSRWPSRSGWMPD